MRAGFWRVAGMCGAVAAACGARAGDWPQWRFDAARTASCPDPLPAEMELLWRRDMPPPAPAWKDRSNANLDFDRAYEPVARAGRLFVPSMVSDRVTAYRTETGEEIWRFYAEGPVRFAPVAFEDRVFFTSDDGRLYSLDAGTGRLVWSFRGGPSGRRIVGNDRLISAWPARTGAVLYEEAPDPSDPASPGRAIVYFAAGIWPFMGVFVHALDARTGQRLWTNSGADAKWMAMPHPGSFGFGGIAPQGYLAATADRLLVPNGRSTPAGFDRRTGEFLYFNQTHRNGGHWVAAAAGHFFNGGLVWKLADGSSVTPNRAQVLTDDSAYLVTTGRVCAFRLPPGPIETVDARGTVTRRLGIETRFDVRCDPVRSAGFKAGTVLYVEGASNTVAAVEVGAGLAAAGTVVWRRPVSGQPWSMLAADGKLFVVTREGRIHCYGSGPGPVRYLADATNRLGGAGREWEERAAQIVSAIPDDRGYCVLLGIDSGGLLRAMLEGSRLHVIVLDPDEQRVARLRREMDEAGLYGRRVCAVVAGPRDGVLPPYLADAIACEATAGAGGAPAAATASSLAPTLRPYGGSMWIPCEAAAAVAVREALPDGFAWTFSNGIARVTRPGPLPGAGSWTHQYADCANTVVSEDDLVRPPLGLLWFGGPPNDAVLPRHGHGPSPQVMGGRLFIEGRDMLRAVDVYSGRLLWEHPFPNVGKFFDTREHQPGAGGIGGNCATAEDAVYLMSPDECRMLDPATGRLLNRFRLPGKGVAPRWGSLRVCRDLLVVLACPMGIAAEVRKSVPPAARPARGRTGPAPGLDDVDSGAGNGSWGKWFEDLEEDELEEDLLGEKDAVAPVVPDEVPDGIDEAPRVDRIEKVPGVTVNAPYAVGSQVLTALDRHTGAVRWRRDAAQGFRHNAVAAGGGKVFCIDGLSAAQRASLRRRGFVSADKPALLALDAATGRTIWTKAAAPFGTWLSYSEQFDVLLEAHSRNRDRPDDEPGRGIAAHRGADGALLWADAEREYGGPVLVRGREFITNGLMGEGYDLLTGKPAGWKWFRTYGCNTAIGSRHLLTFRSGSAGYYDLTGRSGTANLAGFRAGCTSNLIPADGVLSAPDYTRTCTCAYQNQTSLALIHAPESEMWTFRGESARGRLGVNFGAPGNRRADDGTLWTGYPSVEKADVKVSGCRFYRHHASEFAGSPRAWIGASALEGAERLRVGLPADLRGRPLAVRLYFCEPDPNAKRGDRVFSVALQGRTVLRTFDILAEAGPRVLVVKEVADVTAAAELEIELTALKGHALLCGVEAIAARSETDR